MNTNGRHLAPFVALEAATALSGAANGVSMVAFPWLVLELTGSASSAAAIGAITLVPLLAHVPPLGDARRHPRPASGLGRERPALARQRRRDPDPERARRAQLRAPRRACRDRRLLRPGRDHRSRVDAPRGGAGRGPAARAGERDARGDLGRRVPRRARRRRPADRRRRRDERVLGDGGALRGLGRAHVRRADPGCRPARDARTADGSSGRRRGKGSSSSGASRSCAASRF